MAAYKLERINDSDFSVFYAVYAQENIFLNYNWTERLESSIANGAGYVLLKDGIIIGGLTFQNRCISAPFLVPPFCEKAEFWREILHLLCHKEDTIFLNYIPNTYFQTLKQLGAVKKYGQYRMIRPISKCNVQLNPEFYFSELLESDKSSITKVVYEAHLNGYTSSILGRPDIGETAAEIERRYVAFSQTKTLHLSTIIKKKDSGKIAAVCIAGIYPDSMNRFSTIHQVSVLPEYRRRGLAEAMIKNTINKAQDTSPVITLGVMAGNPAKKLYEKLGFVSGCEYDNYIYQ